MRDPKCTSRSSSLHLEPFSSIVVPTLENVGYNTVAINRLHDDLGVTTAKEVIKNGNAPLITKVVEGVETIIAPTTVEEKAQRRLELKAVGDGYANNEGKEILKEHWKKLTINGNETIEFDKSKSDQAEEGPNNFALMAYSSTSSNSEVSTDSNYSSPCLENVKILKEQNEQLLKDLRTSKLNAIAYKIGLESVEARLLVYKKNEYVFEEDIKVLKCEIHLREVAITELKRKLELAQKQKDKFRKFMPPKPDLSFSGLEEFTSKPIVIKPIVKNSEDKASEAKPKVVRKNNGAPIIKDWVSDNEEDDVL
ncbi:hypothetical protein Tco_0511699 [Tanacetum coccineum]